MKVISFAILEFEYGLRCRGGPVWGLCARGLVRAYIATVAKDLSAPGPDFKEFKNSLTADIQLMFLAQEL